MKLSDLINQYQNGGVETGEENANQNMLADSAISEGKYLGSEPITEPSPAPQPETVPQPNETPAESPVENTTVEQSSETPLPTVQRSVEPPAASTVVPNKPVNKVAPTKKVPDWVDIAKQPVEDVNYVPPTPAKKNTGIYDIVKSYGGNNYEDQLARAKRQRNAAALSDLAGIFAQGVGAANGQRIFGKSPNFTAGANANVEAVRQKKEQADMADADKEMNAKIQDYGQDKSDQSNALRNAYNLYKTKMDSRDKALKNNADIDKTNAEGKMKTVGLNLQNDRNTESARHNKTDESLKNKQINSSNTNAALQRSLEAKRLAFEEAKNNNKSSKYKTIALKDPDGVIRSYQYDPQYEGALPSAYSQMSKAYSRNPKKHQTLPDVKIGIGEGGEQNSKTSSVIRTYANQYPEVTNYIKGILHIPTGVAQHAAPAHKTATIKKGWGGNIDKWK